MSNQTGAYKLTPAARTKVGDRIVFQASFANYTVEEISTDSLGQVRHLHGDGTASSSYHPGELLRVELPGA